MFGLFANMRSRKAIGDGLEVKIQKVSPHHTTLVSESEKQGRSGQCWERVGEVMRFCVSSYFSTDWWLVAGANLR
jgi:hypothetical protein